MNSPFRLGFFTSLGTVIVSYIIFGLTPSGIAWMLSPLIVYGFFCYRYTRVCEFTDRNPMPFETKRFLNGLVGADIVAVITAVLHFYGTQGF